MDIITVVFCGDLSNLIYQAHSLKKNWLGEKKWYLIIEDLHHEDTILWCRHVILPIMADWDVKVIPGRDILSKRGYNRQQIYKLWAASEIVDSDYSLILDAKNFLVRSIDGSWFFIDNKQKVALYQEITQQSSLWKNCCNFFGKPTSLIQCPYNVTPWVWRKDLVKYTISKYKEFGCDIYTHNTQELPACEFEAYWFWSQDKIEWIRDDTMSEGVLGDLMEVEFFKERIDIHLSQSKPFLTYHRYHFYNKDLYTISNEYLKFLGVVDDALIRQWIETNEYQYSKWDYSMNKFIKKYKQ